MSTTANEFNQNEPVLNLLNQILALPEQQRLALIKAWSAIDIAFDQDIERDGSYPENVNARKDIPDPNEVIELNTWIAELQTLPMKERIAKMQSALDDETEEWATLLLSAEIVKIKNAQPWLAAEIAVMKYAYEHPLLMTVALSGVGLGMYRLFKGVFKIVF